MEDSAALQDPEELREPRDLGERLAAERPALLRFLRRLAGRAGGVPDPEDVAQEVLARALAYRSFDTARALGPWLRTAAVNAFLDHVARARRRPSTLRVEPPDESPPSRATLDDREHVALLLARLGPLERELLIGFHREGRSIAELARDHGLPEGTVKSHLSRARRRLAQEMPGGER
ncbi:MAG: sigma-70 family RNA polymerase sigma factor [bacterium]|nr:sigma-70 family RNA polymerase sigma factor [bacterium]